MEQFTTKQTANLLGYNDDSYIRKLIASGKLKAAKKGKEWLISKDEIWRFEIANKIAGSYKSLLIPNFELSGLVEVLVLKKRGRDISPKDGVAAYALTKGYKTHGAILQLCKSGYGEDAGILVRSLFELLITLLYIIDDSTEERAYRYMSYDWVMRKKMFETTITNNPEILSKFNERRNSSKLDRELFEHVLDMAKKVEQKYAYKNGTWSDRDLRSMAQSVGRDSMYDLVYRLYSQNTHSFARTMNDYARSTSEGIEYSLAESENWIQEDLIAAFDCYSQIVEAVSKHFSWVDAEQLDLIKSRLWEAVDKINKSKTK